MTNNNYAQEDTHVTTDNAIESFHSQLAQLQGAVAFANTSQAEIEQHLGSLYQQAEAASDEAAKSAIVAAWQRTQQLTRTAHHLDAALSGAAATVKAIDEQRRAVMSELETLIGAIEDCDVYDPRLRDFALEIEMDVTAEAETWADDIAFEQLYDDIVNCLIANGLEYGDAVNVFEIIRDGTLTPSQRVLLQHFAHSLRGDE